MFIGRKSELQFLNDAYSSDKAELIVLYGRRRVGKTELLKEFCKNKPAISYTCRELTDAKHRIRQKFILNGKVGKEF